MNEDNIALIKRTKEITSLLHTNFEAMKNNKDLEDLLSIISITEDNMEYLLEKLREIYNIG